MEYDVDFVVTVSDVEFSGATNSSSYCVGYPTSFFEDMARDWRGWHGEKQWADIEDSCTFKATMDAVGHVKLMVLLRGSTCCENRLVLVLHYEAGQLDDIAKRVKQFFISI
jgi:hypothetical protein